MIKYFVEQDLDALFIATNVFNPSAFDRAERRMIKLSKAMSGLKQKDGWQDSRNAKLLACRKDPCRDIGKANHQW